jgi:hypothetical protein
MYAIKGRLLLVVLLVCALLLDAPAQNRPHRKRTHIQTPFTLGSVCACQNLTLIPIYTSAPSLADYLTLDEGLKARTVIVAESKNTGIVNLLFVTNRSHQSLFLMAGEILIGGLQNRCVGRDTIIPPGKTSVPITVFCVEHARWAGHAAFLESAPAIAETDVRNSAQKGAFAVADGDRERSDPPGDPELDNEKDITGVTQVRVDVRSVPPPILAAQEAVWAKWNRNHVNFRDVQTGGEHHRSKSRNRVFSLPVLMDHILKDARAVGVLVAIDGEFLTADIFGDPALFHKLWPKLARSYAQEAARPATEDRQISTITIQQAQKLLAEITGGRPKDAVVCRESILQNAGFHSYQIYRFVSIPSHLRQSRCFVHENILHNR